MSRVLPGTAPHVTAQTRVALAPAAAWIEARYEAFRGQWVAVNLQAPVLVANVSTLHQMWINSAEDIVQKKMPSISDAMIIGAEALENGDLLMKLSNEVTLFFPHSDEIESWELRWLNGKQIISLPGGGFAEF